MSTLPEWEWNKPHTAVDPATFGLPAERTPLSRWIDCYDADGEKTRAARLGKSDDTTAQLPLAVMLDIAEDRDERNSELLVISAEERRRRRREFYGEEEVENLFSLPSYLRNPLMREVSFLRKKQKAAEQAGKNERPATVWIRGTLKRLIRRIERINSRFSTPAFQRVVISQRLDALMQLPELSKREVQTAATLTAGALESEFIRRCDRYGTAITPGDALDIYQYLARMAFSLNVVPPSWHSLRLDDNRRNDPDMEKLPGALARLTCATWWQRKLWRLRRVWREEQLRAAGLVSRQASPYLSREALTDFREQRRRMREFLKSYELVNEDDFTIGLDDVYYAGNSNPKHRRIEMMTTMKGLEMIAAERGDTAAFLTVTTPSRFHANNEDGTPNPKWDGSTVRDSSDYLVNVFFTAVRKKLNRQGLRWYGMRIAEPHHDGTVHWHMMMFSRPEDRDAIISVVRDIAVRADRAELGHDITPRFKCERVTADKGTPTSYIAKYIGKNIDGDAVSGNDKKTGKPLTDNDSSLSLSDSVERVTGWAGLHGVQQFRFFGIPSRQAWRELRRLASQMKRCPDGPQQLPDRRMDAVLAAADAGCFASYIMKQGGVLLPRDRYIIRPAYALAEKPNDYGENGIQLYGIWAPLIGTRSIVCTHPDNWQLVRKQKKAAPSAQQDLDLDLRCLSFDRQGDHAAPWTRGNNCPGAGRRESYPQNEVTDFTNMTPSERRDLMKRLRETAPVARRTRPVYTVDDTSVTSIVDFADSIGWKMNEWQAKRMAAGGEILRDGRYYCSHGDGRIYSRKAEAGEKPPYTRLDRRMRRGISTDENIRLPPPPGAASQQANELIVRWKNSLMKMS
ncbi:phage replication protein [Trabulsiella guamensis ATCC 49490]|uniref:Phage replication protein n=1 Tax=Trabulsiella guamensis ATCC 49490 TaxID=1005994 RepID=A0A084ZQC7_9ENTR|nr:replication endonuclease [Trabulsiella guamensis]KFB99671.1 phage replication protein [Trabulsiella guamensis ATCC 49490]